MALNAWGWLPRPKTFLGLISLQNGTEMITLTLIFNKLTGFYGLLAILTGYSLSLLQFSMYIYSLGVLLVTAALLPHIRKQTPFECLALAWLYIIDTVLNAAYTTAFALSWFAHSTALERHPSPADGSSISANSAVPDATLATGTPVVPDVPGSTKHIGPEESWTSLGLVIGFTVVRVYLALVVMAFAQQVLQRVGESGWVPENRKVDAEDLFARGTPEGEGWKGRLGRKMLSTGRSYWLDESAHDEWAKNMSSKMRGAAAQV
ncbi:Inositol phosphorylceramide synthase regulatory subunit kei1 like protein [Verticillium longisporum]|uniref:Inositol phosphorylceramide synthase regulatory subunit kei1 like protein n=2 Tax=Verticillium TaxID=1036719 RepID=A0A8I2ZAY5_VERLO|nr:Inositol phosphorylceramide synthase regulatory subunit kei1 like protein [Verticillium longisporum]KAG7119050.1 Inositol phosphorylceramide synthase regulatory subunit kei1 like protein [Verticillium longisporum]PNH40689.1 hypothetical protein VD0004_g6345 [Verticillium dahliae]PNH70378.1 hypothetical protein VD0001_g6890 [Verticillium dahliae]RXG48530.1 hypothetical protein VDGE_10157 [Verticillium dahliae]